MSTNHSVTPKMPLLTTLVTGAPPSSATLELPLDIEQQDAGQLYKRYGTNEPYTKPEREISPGDQVEMFELMIGPSTNFYVGSHKKHYTIPKRLLYHYSDYAKVCLEGNFSEANANAIFLPDVDPDVFSWLWAWLYGAGLDANRSLEGSDTGFYLDCIGFHPPGEKMKACQLLCRLHVLGERLFFDHRFLRLAVKQGLERLAQTGYSQGLYMGLTPEIVQEVLEGSAMVPDYDDYRTEGAQSLRPYISKALCRFEFCTTVDFRDYATCFELDGGFAAEFLRWIAKMIRWTFRTWKKQFKITDGFNDLRKEFATHQKSYTPKENSGQKHSRSWLALKLMCASVQWTNDTIYEFGPLFEMDGEFAASVLNSMAAELAWFVEQWGRDRGENFDFTAEKEFYDQMKKEDDDNERHYQRYYWGRR